MSSPEDDLWLDAMREDVSRGSQRKPLDMDERRRQERERKAVVQAFRDNDRETLVSFAAAFWTKDSPEYQRAIAAIDELLQRRLRR